jgi:hypothetical protein
MDSRKSRNDEESEIRESDREHCRKSASIVIDFDVRLPLAFQFCVDAAETLYIFRVFFEAFFYLYIQCLVTNFFMLMGSKVILFNSGVVKLRFVFYDQFMRTFDQERRLRGEAWKSMAS